MSRRFHRAVVALVITAAVILAAGSSASADGPVLPKSDSLPWTDPAHNSPLEVLATQLASEIARRQVRVYCNGDTDWDALGANREFDPNGVGGFVDSPKFWYPASGTFADSSSIAHLSPKACLYLWRYGMADVKPTKCETFIVVNETQYKTVRYKTRVRKRVKVKKVVNGKTVIVTKFVWTTVWKTKQVPVTVETQVPGPPAPCYGLSGANPPSGWSEYNNYAYAILVLTHESVHLFDFTAGRSVYGPFEARATCSGIQLTPSVVERFGGTADDGRAVAKYQLEQVYPRLQGTQYWSPDCREGGSLDLSPGDGVWP